MWNLSGFINSKYMEMHILLEGVRFTQITPSCEIYWKKYGHFKICQHVAICTIINLDATTFLLTKASSSEVKGIETQEINSAGYTKVSYQTFVLSLVEI